MSPFIASPDYLKGQLLIYFILQENFTCVNRLFYKIIIYPNICRHDPYHPAMLLSLSSNS